MGTEVLSKDYLTLLRDDIPKGRDDLISTSKTLEEVADHCLTSYDKSLDQTIKYTAQALGSVAYKINLLASNFLEVLDQQNLKLNTLQTKVNHLNMQVQIHQEKTARLSIGKYTLPRDPNAMRPSRLIEPIRDVPSRYKRREIDFTALDHIGHGAKEEEYLNLGRRHTEPQLGGDQGLYNSSRRSSTSGSETPSSNYGYGTNSLGPRAGSEFVGRYAGNRQHMTVGRSGGLSMGPGPGSQIGSGASQVSGSIYRAPAHLRQQQSQQSQIVVGPAGPAPPSAVPPPPPPNIVSPQHMKQQQPQSQYGYTGNAGMAVPPPPLTNQHVQQQMYMQQQQQQQQQQQHQQQLPPPPPQNMMEKQQHQQVPPPPIAQPGIPSQYRHPQYCATTPISGNTSSASGSVNTALYNPSTELPPPPPPASGSQYSGVVYHRSQSQQSNTVSQNIPPPPSASMIQDNNSQQFFQQQQQQRFIQQTEASSIDISHLQPTPKDVRRSKAPNDPTWAPDSYICKVTTLYAYQQNKVDELSFVEGELIYVLKKNSDGWWEGVMQTGTGLFPGNYVTVA